jgi:uncharacterized protein YcnI
MRTMPRRVAAALVIAAAVTVLGTGLAAAHVSIERSGDVGPDGMVSATVSVPNEQPAGTTSITLVFPDGPAIATATAAPVPGWTPTVETAPDGSVRQIVWTGGPLTGSARVALPITFGPVPGAVTTMDFKALQGYADGAVVRWIEVEPPGGPEPEHPAPVLTVRAAPVADPPTTTTAAPSTTSTRAPADDDADQGAGSSDDGGGLSGGTVAVIVVAGLLIGGGIGFAIVRGRRRA